MPETATFILEIAALKLESVTFMLETVRLRPETAALMRETVRFMLETAARKLETGSFRLENGSFRLKSDAVEEARLEWTATPFSLYRGRLEAISLIMAQERETPNANRPTVSTDPNALAGQVVPFIRKRDYVFVQQLGEGACGVTVLLRDPYLDQLYVCKKYRPYDESERAPLFAGFVREIKILHDLHHRNVVRIYGNHLYPESYTGFLLMEYVDGSTIDKFAANNPESLADLFIQAVAGFGYLQASGVLHRDIRFPNILVRADGVLKIIDLGFGKRVSISKDFDKSISLNWPFAPPSEFAEGRYDFTTEVYFLGKLFESLVASTKLTSFKYADALAKMCQRQPEDRFASFRAVEQALAGTPGESARFTDADTIAYRAFADSVFAHVSRISVHTKYHDDVDQIADSLRNAHRSFMLEREVPDCASVLRCLLFGEYFYRKSGMSTDTVRAFVALFDKCGPDGRKIILANLRTRMDRIPRYDERVIADDDIPF